MTAASVSYPCLSRGCVRVAVSGQVLCPDCLAGRAVWGVTPAAVACVGFADCPCLRCRRKRFAASTSHPDHTGTDPAYCEPCTRARREATR